MQNSIQSERGFGIYIHWPFCSAKCPYCDFNSHVRHSAVNQHRFAQAILKELQFFKKQFPDNKINTIFFGGGTPSLMHPEIIHTILSELSQIWPFETNIEITLEANPTSVEASRFQGYKDAGVNRVSLGVQSLNDDVLKFLGRMHNANEARNAITIAQKCFDRVSFDLIYARPEQTIHDWNNELSEALHIGTQHLSAYQLTIEPDTMFAARFAKGDFQLPDEDTARAMYDLTLELTEKHGLCPYEISNYAAKGQEARHNLIYWRGHDWIGVGAGAHSRLTHQNKRYGYSTIKHPETWLTAVETYGHGLVESLILSPQSAGEEFLIMGLRTRQGISLADFETRSGAPLNKNTLDTLIKDGYLVLSNNGLLCANYSAWPVLNRIIRDLLV